MVEEKTELAPMSDVQYSSYLAFAVGYLYAALVAVRNSGQISDNVKFNIDSSLETIRPTISRVYTESFQRPTA